MPEPQADNITTPEYLNTIQSLKAKFNLQQTGHIDFDLEQFEVFKHCHAVEVQRSYAIKSNDDSSYILCVQTHCKAQEKTGITDTYDQQIWALAYLKQNLGRVLIRPETLRDKIVELIHPLEIDFKEDKAFSDTFYVVANDHEKAVNGINRHLRNAIMDVRHDDFIIEIVDHALIIGSKKNITPEKSVHLAEFVSRVAEMC